MEKLRVTNLLTHSVGVAGIVVHPRVDGDPSRPGYKDISAEEIAKWREITGRVPETRGWVKIEPIGGEAVAKPKVKEEVKVVPTTTLAPTTTTEAPEPTTTTTEAPVTTEAPTEAGKGEEKSEKPAAKKGAKK